MATTIIHPLWIFVRYLQFLVVDDNNAAAESGPTKSDHLQSSQAAGGGQGAATGGQGQGSHPSSKPNLNQTWPNQT